MSFSVLVNGAGGFVGKLLVPYLSSRGFQVLGTNENILNLDQCRAILQSRSWDFLIHLAGLSHLPTCEERPADAYTINTAGAALTGELLARYSPKTRLIFMGTAQQYAPPIDGSTIDESFRIDPVSLYGRTKWAAELILQDQARRGKLYVSFLRLFNHTHKTHAPSFFLPHLYHELLRVQQTGLREIPVGNLDVHRDVGSVQDLLSAIEAVLRMNPADRLEVFNVCSGVTKHIGELATMLARAMGVDAQFVVDPSRVRSGEAKALCGTHAKLTARTGWVPRATSADALIHNFLADINF